MTYIRNLQPQPRKISQNQSVNKNRFKKRTIHPFRCFIVVLTFFTLIGIGLWGVIKVICLIWSFISNFHLFPPHNVITEKSESPVKAETVEILKPKEETPISDESMTLTTTKLAPLLETLTFEISSSAHPSKKSYLPSAIETKKLNTLKEKAQEGELTSGILLTQGVIVQLNDVSVEEDEIKVTYQLSNVSNQSVIMNHQVDSSWESVLFYKDQPLKDRLNLYEETVTDIYPFQTLVQSYKNHHNTDSFLSPQEYSCNENISLKSNETTTCSLIYDYVGTGDYTIVIKDTKTPYQDVITLTSSSKPKSSKESD